MNSRVIKIGNRSNFFDLNNSKSNSMFEGLHIVKIHEIISFKACAHGRN